QSVPSRIASRGRSDSQEFNRDSSLHLYVELDVQLAGVAKLADAQDLKSWVRKRTCGFDPRPRQINFETYFFHFSTFPLLPLASVSDGLSSEAKFKGSRAVRVAVILP